MGADFWVLKIKEVVFCNFVFKLVNYYHPKESADFAAAKSSASFGDEGAEPL
jgi:hypothetical protein